MTHPNPSLPPSPSPDPRLGGQTSRYDRNEVISQLVSFYRFLPHIPAKAVHEPPPGGWPSITPSTLGDRLGAKSPEVIELLQRLPYIDGVHRDGDTGYCHDTHPWIAHEAYPCDYRVVGELSERDAPGWACNVRDDVGLAADGEQVLEERWPPWVVQLTTGSDREGSCWMLDTTDGTVTRYCVMKSEYAPTYPRGDARVWRDRACDPETKTLGHLLAEWRLAYRDMAVLGLPDLDSGGGYPSLYFRGAGPGSYHWEETEVSTGILGEQPEYCYN